MMERDQAREALASAESAASRMRRAGRRPHTALILLSGVVMMALTAVYGLLVQPQVPYAVPVLLLLPLLALVIYTATRPVLPRHYRPLYAVTMATGAGVHSLTVTIGSARFSGEPAWWLLGAVLCGVPFLVIGVMERKAGRTAEGER
ncbi:hypothetical protein LUX01_02530 [Streptomyces sudanensis]|uniref:hypothetical protein n=1 Tax=Streptomyces sudanensis TaxID=436397 RepID=UPI0020CC33F3|nr:hypothetical protein [Streptomyces sudanensis]MCP9985739.1 hypothetical protein [Streptomyces sudanensis]